MKHKLYSEVVQNMQKIHSISSCSLNIIAKIIFAIAFKF